MNINIPIGNRNLAITAPEGAGAYYSSTGDGTVTIWFALMQQNETGLKCVKRVRSTTNLHWKPVSASPEYTRGAEAYPDEGIRYDLVLDKNGVWAPSRPELTEFLEALQLARAFTAPAPSALAIKLESVTA